ncbi:Na(+)-translocating NADH-quinone reductase subunit F [Pelotomaculum propionicicum]|uniref:Na(+)-translocating NADH-quinone reductase subunit F n=2 Tax=Pelotomaculum propionicicum TaxID=258475 RepID=A0A4Y7RW75_9FIRM|nr:Na(+)-translocating NADH-quinone reductase subunit F [Pelotomaculum propionicicum]
MSLMAVKIIFQPSGLRGRVEEGISLLEAARQLGVDIESVCGSTEICGKCKVKIEAGYFAKFNLDSQMSHLSGLSGEERGVLTEKEIAENYRLACSTRIYGDVLVFVPEESRGKKQVVLEQGKERLFKLNPAVRKIPLEVEAATLGDLRGDFERIRDALAASCGLTKDLTIDFPVLCNLPNILRYERSKNRRITDKGMPLTKDTWNVTVTIWNNREIILVEPGLIEHCVGLAVDVGTTTVVAYLCDLKNGKVLDMDSMMNPQVRYGEDVLSRISYVMMNESGMRHMRDAIIEGINTLTCRLAEKNGFLPEDIVDVVMVFNTVMQHAALGIEPKFLGRSPFIAGVKSSMNIKARDLGIKVCQTSYVHTLPIAAGFVGADNVGVLIAEEPYREQEKIRMCIDIGTNGEIDIGNADKMLCTSCATGPALEGAQIKFGMRAAPGAIEKARIDPETIEISYKVIGQEQFYPELKTTGAKGICGSGIIDIVAELFKAGIIQSNGRFNMGLNSNRIRKGEDGKPEYVVAWAEETSIGKDITFNQADVRAVQLAKAALYVGANYLMEKLGVDCIDSIVLAGAFGNFIDRESAMVIGMIPDCDLANVVAAGNAAGDGAKLALFDVDKREEAAWIAREIEFIETAIEPDFQKRFVAAMAFPHAGDKFPHIQHLLDKIPKP